MLLAAYLIMTQVVVLFPSMGSFRFRLLLGGVNYIFRHDTVSICIGKYDSGRENGYLLCCCPQGYFVGWFTQAFYFSHGH